MYRYILYNKNFESIIDLYVS